MLASPRLYRAERDLERMLALLQAGRAAANGSYYIHTGDLKWWLYYPPLGSSWWEHIYLWDDPAGDGRLLGWALLDPGGETFDVYTHPDIYATPLTAAMFAWAEEGAMARARAAGGKGTGMFWVRLEDRFRIAWLEEHGYQVAYQDAALARSLAEPVPDYSVPEGFTVRPCRGLDEVEARARAQYGAFGSSAPFEQYVARFAGFMQSPAYATCCDLAAAESDGEIAARQIAARQIAARQIAARQIAARQFAAFAITWTDEVNRVALFEPVGTHPDFQRKGLGKAVLLAALQRLQAQGMQQAIVCTAEDNAPALHLYASVGFQPYTVFRFYSKAVGS